MRGGRVLTTTMHGAASAGTKHITQIEFPYTALNVAHEWTEAKAMTNAEKFLAKILPEIIPYELRCNLHSLRCPEEDCDGECVDCFDKSLIWLQEEVDGE